MEKASCLILAALLMFVRLSAAQTTHTVGGNTGWMLNVNYDTWANSQTFQNGDSLLFTYTPGDHDVLELSTQAAYDNCVKSSPIATWTTGSDTIALGNFTKRWFVCGIANHCDLGMKVQVTAAASSTPSTPSNPATPSTPTTPSTPPATPSTPTTPSTPSTPPATPSPPSSPSDPTRNTPSAPAPSHGVSVSALSSTALLVAAGVVLLA